MTVSTDRPITVFENERRRLTALAYRMTGSVAETEDILQQAWLRFSKQNLATIESPPRWLSTVVTRLCLDHLTSARQRRETYVGAWLPEPLVEASPDDPERAQIVAEEVGIALVLTLETLSPEMRAAFILRDAFDYSYTEISDIIGQSSATCRQFVSRARRRLTGIDMPAEIPHLQEAAPLIEAFWQASREGDMQRLLDLFAEDIEVHTDGGGKVPASINILQGRWRAARLFTGIAQKWGGPVPPCPPLCRINGSPGVISVETGNIVQTTAFDFKDHKISRIWIMRNPEKLGHLA